MSEEINYIATNELAMALLNKCPYWKVEAQEKGIYYVEGYKIGHQSLREIILQTAKEMEVDKRIYMAHGGNGVFLWIVIQTTIEKITDLLINTQPMTGPVGEIFKIKTYD